MINTVEKYCFERPIPKKLRILIILGLLISINLIVHRPFLILDSFGEQDAARLAIATFGQTYRTDITGEIFEDPLFSAPLYTELLRIGLLRGILAPDELVSLMTWLSYFSSAILTAAVFIFIFRMTNSILAAGSGALVLQLNPAYWFNSIYGFPTLVAAALLLLAAISFQKGMFSKSSKEKVIFVSLTFMVFVLSVLIKIDTILAGVILCLPAWRANESWKERSAWLLFLLILAIVAFLLHVHYFNSILPGDETIGFYREWTGRFPVKLGNLLSKTNFEVLTRTFGLITFPLALIVAIRLMWNPDTRQIVTWLVLASLPIIVFWGLRSGNSARHNLMPVIYFFMILSLPFTTTFRREWAVILIGMSVINYFALPPSANTVIPSGRVIENSYLLSERTQHLHSVGRLISQLEDDQIAIIGNGFDHPYYLYEIFINPEQQYLTTQTIPAIGYPETYFISGGTRKTYLWSYLNVSKAEIVRLIKHGYLTILSDTSVTHELQNTSSLAESNWILIDNLSRKQ